MFWPQNSIFLFGICQGRVELRCAFARGILRTLNVYSVIPCRGLPWKTGSLTLPRVESPVVLTFRESTPCE